MKPLTTHYVTFGQDYFLGEYNSSVTDFHRQVHPMQEQPVRIRYDFVDILQSYAVVDLREQVDIHVVLFICCYRTLP